MTGAFSIGDAVVTFSYLTVGGLAVGGTLGFLWIKSLRLIKDPSLIIVAAVLLPWAAYIGGEALHVSGVISTVAAGLMLGWQQHEAVARMAAAQLAVVEYARRQLDAC